MNVLVLGGTGATGKCFVHELLKQGCLVTIIARNGNPLAALYPNTGNVNIIYGTILEMDSKAVMELVKNFDAIGSCLGHRLTLKGIFGKPKLLLSGTVKKLCDAIHSNNQMKPLRFVLMNTTGVKNNDSQEKWSFFEGIIIAILAKLLPPQKDNEQAAEYLRAQINQNDKNISWVIVRPDTLVNEETASEYAVYNSPICSPVFNAGKTSRKNVGHFMADLLLNNASWNKWQGKMPVIYNKTAS